jgi:N-acetylmuramoyl-L-alanine amidase
VREIDKIIVHCTATPECRPTTVEDVRRWHLDRGWSDIGYHYLISLDGSIHEGRPVEKQGAHVSGHNKGSIGIVYVGGLDKDTFEAKDTRTEEQKEALLDLIKTLKRMHTEATVHGHNEFSSKACPCYDVKEEYKHLN